MKYSVKSDFREEGIFGLRISGSCPSWWKAILVGASGCQEAEDNGPKGAFFLFSPEPSLGNDPTYFRVSPST